VFSYKTKNGTSEDMNVRSVKESARPNALTFQEWCRDAGGPHKVAMLLGTTYATVQNWYYGKNNPSVPAMQRLIHLSKHRLTYESIIDSTQPAHKRGV
jgi:hypothetical protein